MPLRGGALYRRGALMDVQIFAILEAVGRFEVDETGALILHSHDGRTLTARR